MPRYKIVLDEFYEEVCAELERVQDGTAGHVVEFESADKNACAEKVAQALVPFLRTQLDQVPVCESYMSCRNVRKSLTCGKNDHCFE